MESRTKTSSKAEKRRTTYFTVYKEDLLKILIAEGYAPEAATQIIGSGHNPESITFTVSFE